ncbi:MAG: hypothetical protein M9958_09950 [Chitinophagales bacterium]|nr:hypothetical protein [Chitinophagales bacterium]
MRKYLLFSIFCSSILIEVGCNKSIRINIPVAQIPIENTPIILPETTLEDKVSEENENTHYSPYDGWMIHKKSVGPILVGMDIHKADSILSQFQKEKASSEDFGFSGGSPAYIYSIDSVPIIAVIQSLNSKKIFAIVVLSESLKTETGISPTIIVDSLMTIYPQMKFYKDEFTGWECSEDTQNQWIFVFITNKSDQIGVYKYPEQLVAPKNKIAKNNWIVVR